MSTLPAPRMLDEMFFDTATRLEPGRTPKVVLIEQDARFLSASGNPAQLIPAAAANLGIERLCFRTDPYFTAGALPGASALIVGRPVERVPGTDSWRFRVNLPALAPQTTAASNRLAPPRYGVNRSQLRGLKGEGGEIPSFEVACAGQEPISKTFLVRTPAAQNIPRILASQLVSGVFKGRELEGMVAIVAPPPSAHEVDLATPLRPSAHSISASLFTAYAVQSLIDGRAVRNAPSWLAWLAIVVASLAATALLTAIGHRHTSIPLLFAGVIAFVGVSWGVLQWANVLLPVSTMCAAFLVTGILRIVAQGREQDRRLGRTLEQAINLSFSRSVFYDQARTPEYLVTLARLLKLPRMVVLERGDDGKWQGVAAVGTTHDALVLNKGAANKALQRARRASGPVDAGDLTPDWSSAAQLAFVSEGDSDLAWVYDLPQTRLAPHSARVAQALTLSLRQMRQWQHRLLAGGKGGGKAVSIESRVSGASRLITVQSEQIREGLDALDTAVLIFHPAGFAIQANRRMETLCGHVGIALEKTTLGEAICALTGISPAQSDTIVQKQLFRGGEMRVPMQDIASRQYVLRVGASHNAGDEWQRVIVLEAVDVSELDQLAELRLSVGMFIDRQLRNDLEAISLGATLALDPRLQPGALARIIGRIKDVTVRATGRLEQVAELLTESPLGPPSPSYPIEARKSISQALERAEEFAASLSVKIDAKMPAISGFTVAEPLMLTDMVEAILRLIIADTAQGGTVTLALEESEEHTEVKVSGGFGMPFDRLCEALDARPGEVPVEYQIAAAGFAEALAWRGTVSYWSAAGDGYRFNIRLRRIG